MWIITTDHLYDAESGETSAVGQRGPGKGPQAFDKDWWEAQPLESHRPFRMFDDDGTLYYEGIYIPHPAEGTVLNEYGLNFDPEEGFEPLDNFGEPNAGCTEIHYQNPETGAWEQL